MPDKFSGRAPSRTREFVRLAVQRALHMLKRKTVWEAAARQLFGLFAVRPQVRRVDTPAPTHLRASQR